MLTLDSPIENISKVGEATARRLKRLGINTVRDLLFYYPFRYENYEETVSIEKLQAGQKVNLRGTIELIENKKSPRKKLSITEALVADDTWQIRVIWFNQPFIAKTLKPGDRVSLSGRVEEEYGGLIMKSPNYEKMYSDTAIHTAGIVPQYNLTANLTQKQVRFLIKQVLPLVVRLDEWLPQEVIESQKLLRLEEAIEKIHFPKNFEEIEQAKKRLAFDELFLLQLESILIKKDLEKSKAETIKFHEEKTKEFVAALPFQLTDAQKKASWQILQDIDKDRPMARLLQGDVGSGKTVVAVIALLNAALNNMQSVLMVPTEILAEQHFNSVCNLLERFNLKIALVTRSHRKANFQIELPKKKKLPDPQTIISQAQIIIGTHALIQEKIIFNNLALAIIDEQHRFGVKQRKTLIEKSKPLEAPGASGRRLRVPPATPHLLSMTATPIPRSLALALYGDLDISVINEMPKDRKPIITRLVDELNRRKAYDFIEQEIKGGRQAFVICPLIDPSDKLGFKSVKDEYAKLDKLVFPRLKIAMMHGRLKSEEKEKIMADFLSNKINILVSTSVVEVGVDVPNATIMMIEGADRFGLAQLHQFRGRVGRSGHQSYCLLFTDNNSRETKERLLALAQHHDGFELAKIDLKYRGPGQVFGTEQKGFPELKVASLFDYELIKNAKQAAEDLITKNPDLSAHPFLMTHVNKLSGSIHLE